MFSRETGAWQQGFASKSGSAASTSLRSGGQVHRKLRFNSGVSGATGKHLLWWWVTRALPLLQRRVAVTNIEPQSTVGSLQFDFASRHNCILRPYSTSSSTRASCSSGCKLLPVVTRATTPMGL
mmetsp:Transcript_27349/g.70271  ORF Transcript_27349/g.70271 Transcript_27349/m.70271 type:complete len:124 (+) Transcript_27349:94-465(+)